MRKLEDFIPADHPLRVIRKMANTALETMNDLFAKMYEADHFRLWLKSNIYLHK